MIALAVLLALTVVLPLLGAFPPIRRGAYASNSIAAVVAPYSNQPHSRGIEAQEVVEWWLAWVAGCLIALPVAVLVPGLLGEAAALVAAVVGNAIARKATGHFDYVGHNIEIMVETRLGHADYRAGEIARMIDRGDQRGMTAEQVDRKLRQWEWLARISLALFARRYP